MYIWIYCRSQGLYDRYDMKENKRVRYIGTHIR